MIGAARPTAGIGPVPSATVEVPEGPPLDPRRLGRFLNRLRRNPTLLAGLVLVALFVGLAGASLVHYGADRNAPPQVAAWELTPTPPGPSAQHPFGADRQLGIDVFSSVARAVPNDLAIVAAILGMAALAGFLLGGWAGMSGGLFDLAAMAVADLLVGVPPFFFVIVLFLGIAPLEPKADALPIFAGLFAFVLWPYYARPVRAVAQRAAASAFVESARAAGAGEDRVLVRHVLPNSLFPVLAQLPIDVFNVFFVLSVFPFVGCFAGGTVFGTILVTPSALYPEWGSLLAYGVCYGWSPLPQSDYWWSYVFPAAAIVALGITVVLLCDGVDRYLGIPTRR